MQLMFMRIINLVTHVFEPTLRFCLYSIAKKTKKAQETNKQINFLSFKTHASRILWNDVLHPEGVRAPLVGNHCIRHRNF